MPVPGFEHPDVQMALDAYVAGAGRTAEVIGTAGGYHGMGFDSALVNARGPLGAPGYA